MKLPLQTVWKLCKKGKYSQAAHIWGELSRQDFEKPFQPVDKCLKSVEKLPYLWTISLFVRITTGQAKNRAPHIWGVVSLNSNIWKACGKCG